jgi:hypothetical protein
MKNGYGVFRRPAPLRENGLAHRIAWELTNGDIPKGMFVCHHCDNRRCINPAHLFLGTATDNMQDAARKGRVAKAGLGRVPKNAILTFDLAQEIRKKYIPFKYSAARLAEEYGMTKSGIYHVIAGDNWKRRNHIER